MGEVLLFSQRIISKDVYNVFTQISQLKHLHALDKPYLSDYATSQDCAGEHNCTFHSQLSHLLSFRYPASLTRTITVAPTQVFQINPRVCLLHMTIRKQGQDYWRQSDFTNNITQIS